MHSNNKNDIFISYFTIIIKRNKLTIVDYSKLILNNDLLLLHY